MDINCMVNNEKKQINITGQSNRYQIKKLTQEKKGDKKRIEIEKLNLPVEYFTFKKQIEIINNLKNLNNEEDKNNSKILTKQIEKKITGYKQQDIDKKNLNIEKIINLKHIIDRLIETEIKCYYCKCEMYILYENVRDLKQWSVDRINNDLGHNVDNIVLACLDCNLKRRCKSSDKFLFTKQLNIIRQDN
jgi:actin-related protein